MSIEDRYSLDVLLEEGRFGALYRAVDRERAAAGDPADVLVWMSPPELARNGPALAAMRRDLARVRELDHPNITRVLDVGQDGDRLFVVSELADGETLRNVLDALGPERLEAREAEAAIEDLSSALAYAHDLGLVHGDVRAENIIVTRDQRVELANFMLASAARSTPFAPTLLDDSRGLAAVAQELRGDTAASQAEPELRALPPRSRKAIATPLAATEADSVPVSEFLAMAGPDEGPQRRYGRRTNRLASLVQVVLPLAGIAALGFGLALYTGTEVNLFSGEVRDARAVEDARDLDVGAPTGDGDPAVGVPGPSLPVAARTAPAPAGRRAESQPGTDAAARETPAAPERSPEPEPAPEARAAPQSAPRGAATLSAQPVTVRESEGVAKITVTRSGDLSRRLEFVWLTVEATAHAGDDYADFGARIESFAPGEARRTLSVPLASDSVPEPSETFYVRFDVEREGGRRAPPTTAEIRIVDDDARAARR